MEEMCYTLSVCQGLLSVGLSGPGGSSIPTKTLLLCGWSWVDLLSPTSTLLHVLVTNSLLRALFVYLLVFVRARSLWSLFLALL